MAESAIQSATSSSSSSNPSSKSVEECVSSFDVTCHWSKNLLIDWLNNSDNFRYRLGTVDVVVASNHVPDQSNVPATDSALRRRSSVDSFLRIRPSGIGRRAHPSQQQQQQQPPQEQMRARPAHLRSGNKQWVKSIELIITGIFRPRAKTLNPARVRLGTGRRIILFPFVGCK